MTTVRLLLFAQAREAAGRANDAFDAATLADLLDAARARYGPDFAAVLAKSKDSEDTMKLIADKLKLKPEDKPVEVIQMDGKKEHIEFRLPAELRSVPAA